MFQPPLPLEDIKPPGNQSAGNQRHRIVPQHPIMGKAIANRPVDHRQQYPLPTAVGQTIAWKKCVQHVPLPQYIRVRVGQSGPSMHGCRSADLVAQMVP